MEVYIAGARPGQRWSIPHRGWWYTDKSFVFITKRERKKKDTLTKPLYISMLLCSCGSALADPQLTNLVFSVG
jgi:hypothetical protein